MLLNEARLLDDDRYLCRRHFFHHRAFLRRRVLDDVERVGENRGCANMSSIAGIAYFRIILRLHL